jgi:LemA protein
MEPFEIFIWRRTLFQLVSVIAISVVLGGFLLTYHAAYNNIVNLDRRADERWTQVTRDLQERYGGIPGVLGFPGSSSDSAAPAAGEVTRNLSAWEMAMKEGDIGRINSATAGLEVSLTYLTMVLKGRPEIEASPEVQGFLAGLEETEGYVSADRSSYNEAIEAYNHEIGSFPASLWAYNWGFRPRAYFTARIGSTEPPSVPAG